MIILSYLLIWSLNSQFEICCTYCCNMLLLQIGPLCGWIRLFFLPPSFVYNNSSLQFYQFLSERLRVRRLIFPVYRHANQFPLVHRFPGLISVTLRSTSLVRLLFFFLFASLSPFFPSRTFFPPSFSLLFRIRLPFSLALSPPIVLSRRWFLRKGWRRSEKDADRRCMYAGVCIVVRSRLSLPARAIPRFAAGPWETAHLPSFRWNGQTTAEHQSSRSFASLPPLRFALYPPAAMQASSSRRLFLF